MKKQSYFAKKCFFLKLIFRDEGHLYVNCLLYILNFHSKCLLFKFSIRGIHMQIPILTVVQNGLTSHQKNSLNLLKNVLFEAYSLRWRLLACQSLLYVLSIYCKCLFSVLTLWHMYAHSHSNSGSKRTHNLLKMVIFC